ncbi:hypothetical protein EB796_015794 [Bugula neritina]|uniref:Uncharacterized protein n=1 Tax=Bugula neritina TaxID=10212 RepID=A0A7J7JHZ3_BUGNE|nr:hypothetical protein EB796_015794 [Bugula neritina]
METTKTNALLKLPPAMRKSIIHKHLVHPPSAILKLTNTPSEVTTSNAEIGYTQKSSPPTISNTETGKTRTKILFTTSDIETTKTNTLSEVTTSNAEIDYTQKFSPPTIRNTKTGKTHTKILFTTSDIETTKTNTPFKVTTSNGEIDYTQTSSPPTISNVETDKTHTKTLSTTSNIETTKAHASSEVTTSNTEIYYTQYSTTPSTSSFQPTSTVPPTYNFMDNPEESTYEWSSEEYPIPPGIYMANLLMFGSRRTKCNEDKLCDLPHTICTNTNYCVCDYGYVLYNGVCTKTRAPCLQNFNCLKLDLQLECIEGISNIFGTNRSCVCAKEMYMRIDPENGVCLENQTLSDKIQDMKEYVEDNPEYFIYAFSAMFTIVVCRYIVMPWADRWQANFERELDRDIMKLGGTNDIIGNSGGTTDVASCLGELGNPAANL